MSDTILGIDKKWFYILIGIIVALALFYALGGLADVLELLNQNIWMPIAIVALGALILMFLRRDVQVWNGPDGMELLEKAIIRCEYFRCARVTFQTLPKGKNDVHFRHDKKHTQFHYLIKLNPADNVKTKVTVAYDPWKPGDWAPRVLDAVPMAAIDLEKEAGHGTRPNTAEKDITGEEPEEDEDHG